MPIGVAVTSCTTALHATLVALGVGPSDEVIVPSYTFIATANAVVHCGATPIFADIDPVTYTLDPLAAQAAITSRTKAIMPVDLVLAADLDAFYALGESHGLAIVEDAAPSLGTHYKGVPVGNSRGPVCFSFHPRKIITTGEGGMIMTNDDALAARLRLLRHHYMSVSDVVRHSSNDIIFEIYDEVGYNLRMTDLQAAIGVAQMGKLDQILAECRRLGARYDGALAQLDWIDAPVVPADRTTNCQSYIVRLSDESPISRDDFMRSLLRAGVTTRRGIMLSHTEPAYVKRFGRRRLPISEAVGASTVILPLFVGMTDKQQISVINAINAAVC